MSHSDEINNLLNHPNLQNFVELYDPVKLWKKALHDPRAILEGKRGIRHDAYCPDFDLRETAEAYFLEGEFPGISSHEAIKLNWLDGSTLHVEGCICKIDLEKEWGIASATTVNPAEHTLDPAKPTNGEWEEVAVTNREDETVKIHIVKDSARAWLNERRTGLYRRTFSFRNVVDTDGIQARIRQGLLRVMVPKTDKSRLTSKRIDIKDGGF